MTNVDDVKGLLDGLLGVERESSVDLGGDLARDDLENLLAELDKEVVEGGLDLLVDRARLVLHLCNSGIEERSVLGLLGGGQDERGVGGGILRLVLADGCSSVSRYLAQSRGWEAEGGEGGLTCEVTYRREVSKALQDSVGV
jgi:hypothetical protein